MSDTSPQLRGLRLGSLVFIILSSGIVVTGMYKYAKGIQSKSWPSTTGVVRVSRLEEYRPDPSRTMTYTPVVNVEYRVADKVYVCDRIEFGGTARGGVKKNAMATLHKYPLGKDVVCYYSEDNPEESVLQPGLSSGAVVLTLFGVGFLVLGTALKMLTPRLEEFVGSNKNSKG